MAVEVTVVPTGTANLASVRAALARCGAIPVVTGDRDSVMAAGHVVVPGVGTFGAAVRGLKGLGLFETLRTRINEGRPTLCICLGMQLLFETSEESPGENGLGVIGGNVIAFPAGVRVPHFGWNQVKPGDGCRFLRPGHAYFANSFCAMGIPPDWNAAFTEHGVRFVSAIEKGDVLACQFHPELSGEWGHGLIERWLGSGTGGTAC